jgi:hypothetical protein
MTARLSIKVPIPEIEDAYNKLSEAVDAHLAGAYDKAGELFLQTNESADARKIWHWLNPAWGRSQRTLGSTFATGIPKGRPAECPQKSGMGRHLKFPTV